MGWETRCFNYLSFAYTQWDPFACKLTIYIYCELLYLICCMNIDRSRQGNFQLVNTMLTVALQVPVDKDTHCNNRGRKLWNWTSWQYTIVCHSATSINIYQCCSRSLFQNWYRIHLGIPGIIKMIKFVLDISKVWILGYIFSSQEFHAWYCTGCSLWEWVLFTELTWHMM